MFRRIVSSLAFSPSLVGQLTVYAKILRREESTRRLGLIFIVLTIVVQSFAVFQPPESTNTSNQNDMVTGGIGSSLNNFLVPYNSNTKHLQDVLNFIGITPDEISSAKFSSFILDLRKNSQFSDNTSASSENIFSDEGDPVGSSATEKWFMDSDSVSGGAGILRKSSIAHDKISWGFAPRFNHDQGEIQYDITNPQGVEVTTVYSRPMNLWVDTNQQISGWVGSSNKLGQFAILQSSGNLITAKSPLPQPQCLDGNSCTTNIIKSSTTTNISQGFVDASSVIAKANDLISYTITIENTTQNPITFNLTDSLDDILEYTTLFDKGGGILNATTKTLVWPNLTLSTNDTQTRTFVVQILNNIPATANGTSDSTSYDCVISNVFGNSIDVGIDCPTPKIVEKVATVLPKAGPTANIIFMITILAISTYFYARSRQLKSEVRLLRKDTNSSPF